MRTFYCSIYLALGAANKLVVKFRKFSPDLVVFINIPPCSPYINMTISTDHHIDFRVTIHLVFDVLE